MRKTGLLIALLLAAMPASADHQPAQIVLAFNGAFVPSELPMIQGSGLDLANMDLQQHDVVSTDTDEDGRPLFSARLTGFGELSTVEGVEQLSPGRYPFICSIHQPLAGELLVLADP